jgi:hypothetical protein
MAYVQPVAQLLPYAFQCILYFAQVGNECMDTCVWVCARVCVHVCTQVRTVYITVKLLSIVSVCVIFSQVSFMCYIPEKSPM